MAFIDPGFWLCYNFPAILNNINIYQSIDKYYLICYIWRHIARFEKELVFDV
jgi:hypothetical protein